MSDGPQEVLRIAPPSQSTSFLIAGEEMLRVASDGFYVRGVKLQQDEHEARAVFDAFVEWCRAQGMFR